MGNDEERGEALVNDGAKHPPCNRCGRTNHTLDKCVARKHAYGTMLHNMGSIDEVECDINNEVNIFNDDLQCNNELYDLMFIQPDVNSLTDWQSTCSKTGIPKTWILLDSQSTIDVFCNGEILTQIHKISITLRTRCNTGMKTTSMRGHLSRYG